MIHLRPYQEQIIHETRQSMLRGNRRVLIQSPTGSGKTALVAHMFASARAKGKRSWFVVHRRELVNQSVNAFKMEGVPCGVIAAGYKADRNQLIQVCSVLSIKSRLNLNYDPDFIAVDECSHLVSPSWSSTIANFPNAHMIGLTATPERLDGKGLGTHFDDMIIGPPVKWLIENGYLAQYRYFAPAQLHLEKVHTLGGDYKKDELVSVMDTPQITGDAIDHYLRIAKGKRAVVFAVSREHSRHIVDRFKSAGVTAEHVDGDTPKQERDGAIQRFTDGATMVLSNVEIFSEGVDIPALEVAILLRPTQSMALHLQQVGRSLRPFAGKEAAIILDHAGNVDRHGLPDDEREWSLDSKQRSKRQKEPNKIRIKICPRCYAAMRIGASLCISCGYELPVDSREVDEVAGELHEVDRDKMRKQARKEQGAARSLQQLIHVGRSRGYKNPHAWAQHVLNGRLSRRTA